MPRGRLSLRDVRRPWREDVVFALATAIETELGGYRLAANYCIDDFYYHPSVAYRPNFSNRLTTDARRIAHEIYDRKPALTARRLARGLKNRS